MERTLPCPLLRKNQSTRVGQVDNVSQTNLVLQREDEYNSVFRPGSATFNLWFLVHSSSNLLFLKPY